MKAKILFAFFCAFSLLSLADVHMEENEDIKMYYDMESLIFARYHLKLGCYDASQYICGYTKFGFRFKRRIKLKKPKEIFDSLKERHKPGPN